jgi:hypothetical protein
MLAPNPDPRPKYLISCSHWGLFPDDNYIGHFSFCVPDVSEEEYAALEAKWQRESEERARLVDLLKLGLAGGATITKLARQNGITKRRVEFLIRRYGLART